MAESDDATRLDVAFLTDVEGNWEYFCRFVELSDALRFEVPPDERESAARVVLSDGWHFIYGGDAVDKGPEGGVGGSVRVVCTLVALKERYPSRVTLLLGNRDCNKMRLTSELAPSEIDKPELVPGPFWVAESKRVTPQMHLQATGRPNTLAERVRWMLTHTMGADGEFERRQQELALLCGRSAEEVPEDEVARSFVESVQEGGFMRRLLQLGQLGTVVGDCLFVHGGVCTADPYADGSTDALGYVPGRPVRMADARGWVEALNAWGRSQVLEWTQAPTWSGEAGEAGRSRGGDGLIAYCVPGSVPSVVMGRHLDRAGMPAQLREGAASYLLGGGIRRLCLGHTPHGIAPTVVKSVPGEGEGEGARGRGTLITILADTSFSDMSHADNRGRVVHEVLLYADGRTRVHGCCPDGARLDYSLGAADGGGGGGDELVGWYEPVAATSDGCGGGGVHASVSRVESGQRFVKAVLENGDYLFCRVDGFLNKYDLLERKEARAAMGLPPAGDGSPCADCSAPASSSTPAPLKKRARMILSLSALGDDTHGVGDKQRDEARERLAEHVFESLDTGGTGQVDASVLEEEVGRNQGFLKLLSPSMSGDSSVRKLFGALSQRKSTAAVPLSIFIAQCKKVGGSVVQGVASTPARVRATAAAAATAASRRGGSRGSSRKSSRDYSERSEPEYGSLRSDGSRRPDGGGGDGTPREQPPPAAETGGEGAATGGCCECGCAAGIARLLGCRGRSARVSSTAAEPFSLEAEVARALAAGAASASQAGVDVTTPRRLGSAS